jgi:hypothetical protein
MSPEAHVLERRAHGAHEQARRSGELRSHGKPKQVRDGTIRADVTALKTAQLVAGGTAVGVGLVIPSGARDDLKRRSPPRWMFTKASSQLPQYGREGALSLLPSCNVGARSASHLQPFTRGRVVRCRSSTLSMSDLVVTQSLRCRSLWRPISR